jgi:hypothetical protein
VIDALDPETMALWRTVAKVAPALEDQHMRWCLVGGLMVALFAIEAGQISRPTADIDILGDTRQRPSGTEWIATQLTKLGWRASAAASPAAGDAATPHPPEDKAVPVPAHRNERSSHERAATRRDGADRLHRLGVAGGAVGR